MAYNNWDMKLLTNIQTLENATTAKIEKDNALILIELLRLIREAEHVRLRIQDQTKLPLVLDLTNKAAKIEALAKAITDRKDERKRIRQLRHLED